jgi:hypothetical protein
MATAIATLAPLFFLDLMEMTMPELTVLLLGAPSRMPSIQELNQPTKTITVTASTTAASPNPHRQP